MVQCALHCTLMCVHSGTLTHPSEGVESSGGAVKSGGGAVKSSGEAVKSSGGAVKSSGGAVKSSGGAVKYEVEQSGGGDLHSFVEEIWRIHQCFSSFGI